MRGRVTENVVGEKVRTDNANTGCSASLKPVFGEKIVSSNGQRATVVMNNGNTGGQCVTRAVVWVFGEKVVSYNVDIFIKFL